jgi:hypothetical protein
MLIILAQQEDEIAARLAHRWQSHNAVLVSAADLSTSGWSLYLASPDKSGVCIGGRGVRNEEIDGVVTRIPRVGSEDLEHIVLSDRQYVAAEMTAFLLAWLSSLACPVLNRPTPSNLGGPLWRAEEWAHLASRLGIPVLPVRRKTTDGAPLLEVESVCAVTVVGEACLGNAAEPLIKNARKLAKAAGTDLLSVGFTGSEADSAFVSASVWPNLSLPETADAVLRCLLEKSVC